MNKIVNGLFNYQKHRKNVENDLKNGRIDITGKYEKNSKLPLYLENDDGIKKFNTYNLSHTLEGTSVQYLFFSKKNIGYLQKLLRYHVWLQSNKKYNIAHQDVNELQIIMKSIYLQYSKNQEKNIVNQIKKLNALVLDYAIPNILSNIEQHINYKKTVSSLPKPIELPKYISSAGTRTNPNFIY